MLRRGAGALRNGPDVAVALYRLGYYHASAAAFDGIAEHGQQVGWHETFGWLARRPVQLPEASEVVERLERYGDELPGGLRALGDALRSEVSFRLGCYRYDTGRYTEAITLPSSVDRGVARRTEADLLRGTAHVPVDGEYRPEALFEQAWAHFMAGDLGRALGSLEGPSICRASRQGRFPEAEYLRAVVAASLCGVDDAWVAGTPALGRRVDDMSDAHVVQLARSIRVGDRLVSPSARPLLERETGGRDLARSVAYLRSIDEERAHLNSNRSGSRAARPARASPTRSRSPRTSRSRRAADRVRAGVRRADADLREQLARAAAIARAPGASFVVTRRRVAPLTPDDEHVLWPLDEEMGRDELGTYVADIGARCRAR